MSGFLPGTRPVSASYGQDVVDDDPKVTPDLETGAAEWNNLKADAAFCGQVVPKAIIRVRGSDAGAFTSASFTSVYGIIAANFTVARSVQGDYTCTLGGGAGFTIADADARSMKGGGTYRYAHIHTITATVARIQVVDNANALQDADFLLYLY